MKRNYIKLYFDYLKVNFKVLFSYGIDSVLGTFAVLLQNIANFFIIYIIFQSIPSLHGWSSSEILILYGFSSLTYSFWHLLFVNTMSVSYYVKHGEMDIFLSRPIDVVFQIMTDSFDEDGVGDFIFGFILTIIGAVLISLSWYKVLLLLLFSFLCSFVYTGISLIGSAISIVVMDNSAITSNLLRLKEFSRYPITIYNGILRLILTFIIPIGVASFYPVNYFLNGNILSLIISITVPIIFFTISILVFNFFLKKYTSPGS